MRITNRTLTRDVLPLLNADNIGGVLEKVAPVPFAKKMVVEMTIAEFAEVSGEGYPLRILAGERKALVAFGKLKDYNEQMRSLANYMDRWKVEQSKDERQAAIGVEFPTAIERMLVEVTRFFGLKSFEEAEHCKIADYLLILKTESSDAKFQRNYNRIINTKKR